MNISARRASFETLTAILRDGAYTALALKNHIPDELSVEDRRFASRLVRTTLENLLKIDYALNQFIKAKRVHGSVRNVLRLGACQILCMDVEGYAAVSESVKLMKRIKPQMKGFVNAVLRSLLNGKESIEYPQGDTAEAISIAYSYPLWICEKFIADFGFGFTKKLLATVSDSGTAVRRNTLKTEADSFIKALDGLKLEYTKGDIEDAYIINGLTGIERLDIFKDGWMAVQSQSAMRAVMETGVKPGDKLLDCCAAPGGKSAYAAALANNDIDIVAWDIHEHRVIMTNKNYERLGVVSAKAVVHDASVLQTCLRNTFDVVIVDAPCSAMGLMARNPDIRYTRKKEDIEALTKKQYDILSACAQYVKTGGTLAYYTCSINKEENEQVTDRFIGEHPAFKYVKPVKTLYPHIDHSDGFYIAVMKREK